MKSKEQHLTEALHRALVGDDAAAIVLSGLMAGAPLPVGKPEPVRAPAPSVTINPEVPHVH